MTHDSNSSSNGQNGTRPPPLPEPMRPIGGGGSPVFPEDALARQEHERALRAAMREREAMRLARRAQEVRSNTALEEARWAREDTRKYEEAGELLRANAQRRRQEQHCEQCGLLFNYTADGTLLPEKEWCDPRQLYCSADLGNSFCVTWQAREDKANKRKGAKRRGQSSGTTSSLRGRMAVSTNGHPGALPPADQEAL